MTHKSCVGDSAFTLSVNARRNLVAPLSLFFSLPSLSLHQKTTLEPDTRLLHIGLHYLSLTPLVPNLSWTVFGHSGQKRI